MGPHQEALTHQTPTPKSPRPLSFGSAPPSYSLALPVLVDPGFAQASFRGKGFGLKATRDFAPGEEIIREAPFVSFRLDDDDVEQAFNYLSGPARLLFLSFTPTINNPNISLYRNIAETNALTCWNQDDADEYVDADADVNEENDGDSILKGRLGGSSTAPIDLTAMSDDDIDMGEAPVKPAKSIGICENICRVNHSCRPNSGWAWDRATSQMVLYAYNTIAANEEITASYHNAYNILPRAQRRAKLLEKFGFDCMCQACSPIDSNSDARLAEFRRIRESCWPEVARRRHSSPTWEEEDEDQQSFAMDQNLALHRLNRAMEILQAENQFFYQGEILERRFRVYVIWGQRVQARQAAEAVLQHTRMHRGLACATKTMMNVWCRAPEKHWLWDVGKKYYGNLAPSDDGDSDFEHHYRNSHHKKKKQRKSRSGTSRR
ncbi:hypothetical protein DB88DRAFT_528961 [Papiliotrema laurentii]|uniref:SET domain-containing protein n=1 Tax=Papiliotrema laurentii TaxID=5418 RepID=A0AAD9D0I7_PAPLA|nr:hypothetical protein DB88DRAFT_528961 [Papiliotrema laurentii]